MPTENPDMAVEVRARLRAFGSGNDPWFGVLTRGGSQDGVSYTYLSLRRSNTVTLRKVTNAGQITQLGAAVFNVTPGAWYRLRLETVGTRMRGYINGQLVVEGVDNQPFEAPPAWSLITRRRISTTSGPQCLSSLR